MPVPPEIPEALFPWYRMKEMYIGKWDPSYSLAFSEKLTREIRKDFLRMAPLYEMLRGIYDENDAKGI
jgi:hypothetical protein